MKRVTSPDGRTWKVGRQWLPRRPRLRGRGDGKDFDLPDASDALSFDEGAAIGIAIAVGLLLITALVILVFPLLVLLIELLVLAILTLAGLFGRFVLGRPWVVRAETKGPPAAENVWRVAGWRASGERVEEVATALAGGADPDGRAR